MARYYEINEAEARAAHEANSMREFKAGSETEGYRAQVDEACRVVENSGIMRLQLVFDGKPEADTRAKLKAAGFRWSPKNGAWQRQLTDNARRALRALEAA